MIGDNRRLRETIRRQDVAIDRAIDALTRLSKTGSLAKTVREEALRALVEARNERIPGV